jgi:hypothetical protein
LYRTRPDAFRLIYLVRDGRAVAFSAMMHDGVPMRVAARRWLRNNLRNLAAVRRVPRAQRIRVRYEDLCAEPETELRRICKLVGVRFEESVAVLDRRNKHNLGGSHSRMDFEESDIRLDDRWRHELSDADLASFGRGAWLLNRLLGYH